MLTKKEFIKEHGISRNSEFSYRLLSRMQADCEYFINACNCSEGALKFLWASEGAEAHIQYMKYIWDYLTEKPEWLTMEQIEEYERRMVK